MDEYSVCLSGETINTAALNLMLERLALTASHQKGDQIVRRPGHVYHECWFMFEATGFELLELLQYLLNLKHELIKLGVQGFEVHALMKRSGQINGELSVKEIAILSKLDANFTWSVL